MSDHLPGGGREEGVNLHDRFVRVHDSRTGEMIEVRPASTRGPSVPDAHSYVEHYEFPGECVTCGRPLDGHHRGQWVGRISGAVARAAEKARTDRLRAAHLRLVTEQSDDSEVR